MIENPQNISIVLATEEKYVEHIVDIIEAAARDTGALEEGSFFNRKAVIAYIIHLSENFDNMICGILAYRAGKPIGYLGAMIMPPIAGINDFMISFISFFWVLKEERDGLSARGLLEALKRWSINRKAKEIHLHVNSGIRTSKTHNMLLEGGFGAYGVNYTMSMPMEATSSVQELAKNEDVSVSLFSPEEDISIFKDLVITFIKEGIYQNRKFNVDEFLEDIRKAIKHNSQRAAFIAKQKGKLVGCAIASINQDIGIAEIKRCYINHFYTMSDIPFAVEAKMIIEMMAWAKAWKLYEIQVFIYGGNRTVQIGEILKQAGFHMAGGNYVLHLELIEK